MTDSSKIEPRDYAEKVAVFRHGIIGALAARESLSHGEVAAQLRALSDEPFRVPGSPRTRTFAFSTLERWLYAFQAKGLEGLRPAPRSDRGRGRELTEELKELLLDIRREYPTVSAPTILQTIRLDGLVDEDALSASTLRRFYREKGLARVAVEKEETSTKTRLRWRASRCDALWHSDVCHGPTLVTGKGRIATRIHATLDDYSRYVTGLHVRSTEQEVDMLDLFTGALRMHGKCDGLYLDNGSTYRGESLQLLCSRLGITLLHARPYDPQARGKMERFWLTMRGQVLQFCEGLKSLKEVEDRLHAWLEKSYHKTPHAGLLGRTPASVYNPRAREIERIDESALRQALLVRQTRRVRQDTTVSIEGRIFELNRGWLAGRQIEVCWSALDNPIQPWGEYEGKRYDLHLVDAEANATAKRPSRNEPTERPKNKPDFDPARTLLEAVNKTDADKEKA